MNLTSSHPFWSVNNGLPADCPSLQRDVHPRFPHACFALGYGGNGITFSLIAAEIIRDTFMGRRNDDARLFRFGR